MLEMHCLHAYIHIVNWRFLDLNLPVVFDAVMEDRPNATVSLLVFADFRGVGDQTVSGSMLISKGRSRTSSNSVTASISAPIAMFVTRSVMTSTMTGT